MYDLPATYVFKQLTAKAEKLATTQANVKLFDPNNYLYINVNPSDSATEKALNDLIAARKDLIIVTDKSKADLVLEANITSKLDQEADANAKWPINKYLSSLNITLTEVSSGNSMLQYDITGFQYLAPTSRTKDQVLHSSAKEMSRQLTRELPDKLKTFSYDKRSLVWSTIK